MPKNDALLSARTYFWLLLLFFWNANFFLLDHISDSFCFIFGESNLECPGIRRDYSNIRTGEGHLDSNEGQMETGIMGPRRKVFSSIFAEFELWQTQLLLGLLNFIWEVLFCSLKNDKNKKKATCLYFQWLSWEILAWRTRQNCGCFPPFWCELSNRNRPETQKQISAWEQSQNSHSNSAGGLLLLGFVLIRFCHLEGG